MAEEAGIPLAALIGATVGALAIGAGIGIMMQPSCPVCSARAAASAGSKSKNSSRAPSGVIRGSARQSAVPSATIQTTAPEEIAADAE